MRFEYLDVWKRANKLSLNIYNELKNLKDYAFKDRITRFGLSIPINIAEGFERASYQESTNFLSYAEESCNELRNQICIGINIGYINQDIGQKQLKEVDEISSILNDLIKTGRNFTQALHP